MTRLPLTDIAFVTDANGQLVNPRGRIRDTISLQNSMRLIGQETPIRVFAGPALGILQGNYGIINGHRRVTAARALGWTEIDADVIPSPRTEGDLLAAMLASDVSKPFTPTALGRALARLVREHRWGIERAAAARGLKAATAQLYVDLALCAPEAVQRRVDAGEMSLSAWKVLRDKPQAVQEEIASSVENPTVRNIRAELAQKRANGSISPNPGILETLLSTPDARHALILEIETTLRHLLEAWPALATGERAQVQAKLEHIVQFIQENNHD